MEIQNKDYMSTINQQAGSILFNVSKTSDGKVQSGRLQITPSGAYMSSGFIKNGHISDATITDAKIKNLSANKLTAGTIDARQIRVTNIDAANITTGTISGTKSFWKLNTGLFQNGWTPEMVPSTLLKTDYTSIQMQDGVFTFRRSGKKMIVLDHKGLQFWGEKYSFSVNDYPKTISEGNAWTEEFGRFTARWWKESELKLASGDASVSSALGVKNLSMSHIEASTMTISYLGDDGKYYYPYFIFDKYNKLPFTKAPITVSQDIAFNQDMKTANGLVIKPVRFNTYDTKNYASAIFLGRDKDWGLLISSKGVWWTSNGALYTGSGKSRTEKKNSAIRLNSTGDRDFQGGAWNIVNDYDGKGTK